MDGKLKPWHYALFVAAIGALAFASFSAFSKPSARVAKSMLMVDINTGQLYEFDISKVSMIIPEVSPETGKQTLYPVRKGEDGKWYASPRYIEAIDPKTDGEPTALVSAETGEVKLLSEDAKWLGGADRGKK